MKKVTKSRILRYVLKNENQTNMSISRALDLSFPTVNQNLKELISQGLVIEIGKTESKGGRKASVVYPVADASIAIGIDISANHINLAAIDLNGKMIADMRVKVPFAKTNDYFKLLRELCDQMLENHDLTQKSILGVGFSVPAIVDIEGSKIINSYTLNCVDYSVNQFAKYMDWPCKLIRDATAGALAEAKSRNEQLHLFYLSLNTTIGGALYVNSELYHGACGRSGEVGHTTLVPGGKLCRCGKRGCMNMYCSPDILSDAANGSLSEFFKNVKAGDKNCRSLLDQYLGYLAIAINNVHMLYDCDVVLGGYMGGLSAYYIDELKEKVADLNHNEMDTDYIKPCSYHTQDSAIGAAMLFTEDFITNID